MSLQFEAAVSDYGLVPTYDEGIYPSQIWIDCLVLD